LSAFDPDRFRTVIEVAIDDHADQERVHRFLRAGAEIHARHDGEMVELSLQYTDSASALAVMRAATYGPEPERPLDAERHETVTLARIPSVVIGQPPQG
jgi:hypothetical protein